MGTRSTISILREDGTVTSCYCHWDGYLENNGAILLTSYQDKEKVKELLSLGAICSLRRHIHATGLDPAVAEKEVTTFFGRDEGQKMDSKSYSSFVKFLAEASFEGFDYIYNEKRSKWYFFDSDNNEYKPLRPLVLKVANNIRQSSLCYDVEIYEKQRVTNRIHRVLQKSLEIHSLTKRKNKI